MSKLLLIRPDNNNNSKFNTNSAFNNARNMLVASAKKHVKNNGMKSNILSVLSKNNYTQYTTNQTKGFGGVISSNGVQSRSIQNRSIQNRSIQGKSIKMTNLFSNKQTVKQENSNKVHDINKRLISNAINPFSQHEGLTIKNVKFFNELLILYKKNRLTYNITSVESFYTLYPDFDLNYYRNRHYKQSTLSDQKIMYDFHSINEYKRRLYNDKIKIVIYTPHLYEKCGGIKALHLLAQRINNLKHKYIYAKLYCYDGSKYVNSYCNDFANPFEINSNTIVIYPEVISGNPLNAKHVIRWILLELGIEMNKTHYLNWNKQDIVYHWEPSTTKNIKQLTIPFIDKIFRNYNNNARTKTCFLVKKGRLIHDLKNIKPIHPTNSVNIDNMSLEGIVKIFNESHTFYCYDPNSFYLLSATLCGCITVVYPIKNTSNDIFFKNRMMYIDNFMFNSGIAYGNSNEQLIHARSTIKDAPNNMAILLSKYDANLNNFVEDIYSFFTTQKHLTTIENEYY